MTADDEMDRIEDSLGKEFTEEAADAPPVKADKTNIFSLATRSDLDKKINIESQTPRLMETVKDVMGNVLIHKYEKLTKPVWQKYRTKPDCKPLHFVCDIPLYVIDNINTTFLIPDDFQFLGALYAGWGNDTFAEQFFTEAMKSGTADAYINAGVYRFQRGERGVVDNFSLAKRHFNKALDILHLMPLTIEEKYKRRKICEDGVDEIEYRFASFFDKIIRFIIRLITFRFEAQVSYVGAAAPKISVDAKIQELTTGIMGAELSIKRKAIHQLLAAIRDKIPVGQAHLEDGIQEIESSFGELKTPEAVEAVVAQLAEFYSHNIAILERRESPQPEVSGPVSEDVPPRDMACYHVAPAEEIEKVAARHRLTSIGELLDMAGRPRIEPGMVAWMIRDKFDQTQIMERLLLNQAIPEPARNLIRHYLTQPQSPPDSAGQNPA